MHGWQERLDEALETRGMSGSELARRTGFTPQYINSLRKKGRGGRLPLETAELIAQALGVTVEWLTKGEGQRDASRRSDVYPIPFAGAGSADRYPSRAEVVALLEGQIEPQVIAALRSATLEVETDPGRQFWIDYAKALRLDYQRIVRDPAFGEAPSDETPPEASPARRGSSTMKARRGKPGVLVPRPS